MFIDDTPYLEMREYDWVKNFEHFRDNSKQIGTIVRRADEIPPAPLSLVLTLIDEHCRRPEIIEMWVDVGLKEEFNKKQKYISYMFAEYLEHKYGNETDAMFSARVMMRPIAVGQYTGAEDPKLINALLSKPNIYDDRESNHVG